MKNQFFENQKFSFLWIKLVLIVLFLVIGTGAVRQIFFATPFGNRPMSDTGIAFLTGFLGLLLLIAYFSSLKTVITDESITLTFFPFLFGRKVILWESIQTAYVREYSPIREYGGWGFRIVANDTNKGSLGSSKALNVKGNQGLQLVFKDGKKLLIGTQQPREIASFLKNINRGV